MVQRTRLWLAVFAVLALVAAGCGGDDAGDGDAGGDTTVARDAGTGGTTAPEDGGVDDQSVGEEDDPSADGGDGSDAGGFAGSIVIGDETIMLDAALCFLEEQDAAAGGGKILFTAQASGTNAAGEEITIDVSRFDEDSQFTGDKVSLVIGDPFSADAVSWDADGEIGAVEVDGSVVRSADLTFVNSDDLSELPGSFEIRC